MKEIELIDNIENGCKYDEQWGNYRELKAGLDDIIIVKNYKHKTIEKTEVSTLSGSESIYHIVEVENCEKYIVKPLDTLKSIANKYNTEVEYIIKKNALITDRLFIGQILKI